MVLSLPKKPMNRLAGNLHKMGFALLEHRGFKFIKEEERRKWQNPEAILAEIGLKPGMTFFDIGCGQGFFLSPRRKW